MGVGLSSATQREEPCMVRAMRLSDRRLRLLLTITCLPSLVSVKPLPTEIVVPHLKLSQHSSRPSEPFWTPRTGLKLLLPMNPYGLLVLVKSLHRKLHRKSMRISENGWP